MRLRFRGNIITQTGKRFPSCHIHSAHVRRGREEESLLSEDVIVRLGAPTLAGIKTGSLFTCDYSSKADVEESVRRLNRSLSPKGLCLLPLRFSAKRVLLYLFRPLWLQKDLEDRQACELLRREGYPCGSCGQCVAMLASRLRQGGDFPHEIGLFLSYPPEDVKGFIENHAANYKYSGLWKVYGNEEKAKKLFAKYKKCTDIYCERYEAGCGIADLAVTA